MDLTIKFPIDQSNPLPHAAFTIYIRFTLSREDLRGFFNVPGLTLDKDHLWSQVSGISWGIQTQQTGYVKVSANKVKQDQRSTARLSVTQFQLISINQQFSVSQLQSIKFSKLLYVCHGHSFSSTLIQSFSVK